MTDYKSMYFKMAGTLADAIEELDKVSRMLKKAQRDGEETFIEEEQTE